MKTPTKDGVLVLDSTPSEEFAGTLFGAPLPTDFNEYRENDRGYGEIVFNTSMTGYQEILTDPSYRGQMVCMTTPHIGNTGVNLEDPESDQPWAAGFLVHSLCEKESNWRSQGSLDAYLKEHGIPGLYGIDTRALTRTLRSRGVVRGILLPYSEKSKAIELLKELPSFEGRDLVKEVTTRLPYFWTQEGRKAGRSRNRPTAKKKFKVAVLDYGVKRNLLNELLQRDCEVEVLPAQSSAGLVLERKPDGVFLSNGPGDPSSAGYTVETVQRLLGKLPIFGVCMGHQVLCQALGASTYKLKFGHRGGNQPVLDRRTSKVEISSHNHGYSVDPSSLPKEVEITHTNLNDHTVEGIRSPKHLAYSVQYHPEACPGPRDSSFVFDEFIEMMNSHKKSRYPLQEPQPYVPEIS